MTIIKQLGYSKVCALWMPRMLTVLLQRDKDLH